ncbi:thioredoxin domain-containing protein [Persephonella atlantica]|uniref:Thioredoxin domain-containing protein n=1 Tax=Persephonella atlantica TaxID=2699429 RepID=A0ABS1GG45_9AQUI|nr:DUF255 domain-containing protein [Persephonella atlantica]MBK3331873.1 thioredoxin domain-containing protein [Persephonella atlantica]
MWKFIIALLVAGVSYASQINWLSFEEGIKKAKEENRLILMDIYAQWCHWCNVMENTTYRDPDVVRIINRHFVPVRVDAEERPEINKKYNQGGLPSTVILDKNGNILYGRIYVPPEEMIEVLSYFASLSDRQIKKIAEENRKKEKRFYRRFIKKTSLKEPSEKFIRKAFRSVKIRFDRENGGFFGAPKFPEEELVHFLILYYLLEGDKEAEKMFLKTAEGYEKLIDTVEGGIYRYSVNQFWSEPHYEKLLKDQADLSVMFFDIYSITENRKYLKDALSLVDFSLTKLYNLQRHLFYNSQGADIVDEEGTLLMSGEEFFKLSREERERAVKKIGHSPKIEKRFYYGRNALISKALLYSYIFTGDRKYLQTGLDTLDTVLKEAFKDKGVLYSEKGGYFLSSNVYTLEAVLTAYQITGEERYLKTAEKTAQILKKYYHSKHTGILTDQQDIGLSLNRISFIDDIILLNRRAIYQLYGLFMITGDEQYKKFADSIIKHLPDRVNLNTAVAYMIYLKPPLMLHVIAGKEQAKKLPYIFRSFPVYTFADFIDRKDKNRLKKIGYRAEGDFVVYLCNADFCFERIKDTNQIKNSILSALERYREF